MRDVALGFDQRFVGLLVLVQFLLLHLELSVNDARALGVLDRLLCDLVEIPADDSEFLANRPIELSDEERKVRERPQRVEEHVLQPRDWLRRRDRRKMLESAKT
jgi:hypothetical protein